MSEIAKPLPQNLEAERSVLGAILLDANALTVVAEKLKPSDFFSTHHQVLFQQMQAQHEAQIPIDSVTLFDELQRKGKLDAAGGAAYIAQLSDGVPRVSHVAHYAAIIKEKSQLRRVIYMANALQAKAMESSVETEDLFTDLERFSKTYTGANGGATNGNGNGHRKSFYPLAEFMSTDFPVPEHLVEGIVPGNGFGSTIGGSVLILAMPHRLKSWFTTGLALGCTRPGKVFDSLVVAKPVRSLIVQVEDPEGVVKDRMRQLLLTNQFSDCVPDNVGVIGRSQFTGYSKEWAEWLRQQVRDFKADLVILDVLRRFFVGRGDLNSPQDSGDFLEEMDLIRDEGCAVLLVHHENRKDAELMGASAGSYNFPGWANVVIQLKRKTEQGVGENRVTRVEIEADNKLGVAPDSLRLVLNLNSPDAPLKLEKVGDDDAEFKEIMDHLSEDWTVRDLADELGVHRVNAQRRIKEWRLLGKVEKIAAGKRGRSGGLARYRCIEPELSVPPVNIRKIN